MPLRLARLAEAVAAPVTGHMLTGPGQTAWRAGQVAATHGQIAASANALPPKPQNQSAPDHREPRPKMQSAAVTAPQVIRMSRLRYRQALAWRRDHVARPNPAQRLSAHLAPGRAGLSCARRMVIVLLSMAPLPSDGVASPSDPAGAAATALSAASDASATTGATRLQAVYTPQPLYPPAARAAGHQGTVVIGVLVSAEGDLLQAHVQRSSRSALLDQAALDAVRQWRFRPATDPLGQAIESAGSVPFTFRKDSPASLPSKTCADLNVDLPRWRSLYPEAPLQDADVYPLAQQLLIAPLRTASQLQQALASFPQAFAEAIRDCQRQPRARFMAQLQRRATALASTPLPAPAAASTAEAAASATLQPAAATSASQPK